MTSRFPSTRWSLIQRVRTKSPGLDQEELGTLLQQYWRPMFVHLRFKGRSDEQAEDLLQDFMVEILTGDLLAIADPDRGKFRTLLLTALDRFAVSRFRYENAAKRSPESLVSLDALETESGVSAGSDTGKAFERAWALDVLAEAMTRMEQECQEVDQTARWAVFQQRIVTPLLEQSPPRDYDELAEECGLENAKSAMNLVVTAKRQFGRLLREVIGEYVVQSADRSAGSENSGASSGRDELAGQLDEHYMRRQVERELSELREILATSGAVADLAQQFREQPQESDPAKSGYWQLLTQGGSAPATAYSGLFELDTDESLTNSTRMFNDILDADGSQLPLALEGTHGSLRECLLAQPPDVAALRSLKDWVNLQRFSQSGTIPGPIANGLYFLTLAVALERCKQRITGLQETQFAAGLDWLVQQHWLDAELQQIVIDAQTKLEDASE